MHFRNLILLFVLLLMLNPVKSLAQIFYVETSVDTSLFCPGTSQAMPIQVKNMVGVDSFNLVLNFNPAVLSYESYYLLHQDLSGGSFQVTELNGKVSINWHRPTETSLFQDTMVMLVFKGITGSTSLTWDTITPGNCIYHSIGDSLISDIYHNGLAFVNPPIQLAIQEIDPTCIGKCDANYLAQATGGTPPYLYLWNNQPGRFDSIQTNLCDGPNSLRIIDSKGCELDSLYSIEGLPGPKVDLKIECEGDTTTVLFRENPILTFSFEEISPTHVIEPPLWEFGDGDTARSFNPTHLYDLANSNLDGFYQLKLHITNQNGCDTLIIQRIPIKDQKLKISNLIVPNGSPENRVFTIFDESGNPLDHEYMRFEVYIFDRWGRRLFSTSDYKNDWSPAGAPDGVYFYVVKTIGYFNTDKHKGSVTIMGGN
ncbi:MAG: gliding motility-associated C-terminal domain-containing protein [Bacteroidales bacterium]|nr:gliding motility-associated C-terminal domain-containing protein [Bacteroidales bacterium]